MRDPETWAPDSSAPSFERASYLARYQRYCGQVTYVARQLEDFLDSLRQIDAYQAATVIVVGDHGSRIRLLKESEREEWSKLSVTTSDCDADSRYDYVSTPELRDLLNRFSALFAIKRPGMTAASEVEVKASLLSILRREHESVSPANQEAGLNSVYLFTSRGPPQEIPLLRIWRGAAKGTETSGL